MRECAWHTDGRRIESRGASEGDGRTFTIEMETGTGKTYTYIKTMYELNARYGWSKFVIVVPSIAIREGVFKSFESMAEHFAGEYGKRMQYFIYNSKQLAKIDAFASDNGIHVMIINTQAFNASLNEDKNKEGRAGDSAARIIFSRRDEFGSRKPIDILAKTNPILIIDEPQSVLGTDKSNATRKGIKLFNPLFTLLYSATHREIFNQVYRLDAIDAYNKKLVKKIEVRSVHQVGSTATNSYVYLDEIVISKGNPQARLGFDVKTANGTRQTIRLVGEGFDLKEQSGGLQEYANNFKVECIDGLTNTVHFLNGLTLHPGEVVGSVNEDILRRHQIRETIKTHLERERQLFARGIKVLSLFFIDHVDSYRIYGKDTAEKGKFARMFEEEYQRALQELMSTFKDTAYTRFLSNPKNAPENIHDGYFSIDKKGKNVESKNKEGENEERGFDLIMKDKERLLSQSCPIRFIFSHSALKEGWDNPNVFQICTLKDTSNEIKKRQEVGRGMRLCVNDKGERQDADVLGDHVFDTNILTVIASESYAGFVDGLQKQTEAVLYDRPRKADIAYFTGKTIRLDGKTVKVDDHQARAIYQYLVRNNYVDEQDNVTQDYRDDVQTGTLAPVPETLKPIEEGVHTLVQAIYDDSMLKSMFEDGNKPKVLENPLNDRFEKAEFQKLWQTINHKYAYTVDFDSEELIRKAIEYIDRELYVSRLQYTVTYAGQKDVLSADMVREGSSFSDAKSRTKKLEHDYAGQVAYDLIGKIAEGTTLTRHTVARILQGIKPTTFAMYQNNPEEFIAKVIRLVKEQKATMIVEHITYDTIEGSYDSSIFTAEKHALTMDKAYKAQKAIQDYVFTDGTAEKSVERKFAENLDGAEEVFIYAKLPKGFYIPTPVGHYSPDWAIVFHEGKVKHIYFVAETKGTMESLNLRPIEKSKIDCAKKLFAKLSDGLVTYDHVDSYQELMNKVLQ